MAILNSGCDIYEYFYNNSNNAFSNTPYQYSYKKYKDSSLYCLDDNYKYCDNETYKYIYSLNTPDICLEGKYIFSFYNNDKNQSISMYHHYKCEFYTDTVGYLVMD